VLVFEDTVAWRAVVLLQVLSADGGVPPKARSDRDPIRDARAVRHHATTSPRSIIDATFEDVLHHTNRP
jgi:hypothetical protein